MQESLDESIHEDQAHESTVERQLLQKERKADAARLSVGLSVGLAVLLLGIFLIMFGGFGSLGLLATGFLFLPLGLWITVQLLLEGWDPVVPTDCGRIGICGSGGDGSDREIRRKREARKRNPSRKTKRMARLPNSAGKGVSTRKFSGLVGRLASRSSLKDSSLSSHTDFGD